MVTRLRLDRNAVPPQAARRTAQTKSGEAWWIVIGHEHPAVGLRDPVTQRVEVYKCFLVGRWAAEKNLLVLPSFNQLVKRERSARRSSPSRRWYVQQSDLEDIARLRRVSDAGSIYEFGPLRSAALSSYDL
jgi:metallophosphoesterase superfamily enzyme